MNRKDLEIVLAKHKKWLNDEEGGERANLSEADLSEANLRWANLSGADLSGADLDFACLHFSCKSLRAHFDDKQLRQIAYHLCKAGLASKNASPDTKAELAKIVEFANGFHRVEECGEISIEEVSELANESEEDS